MRWFDLKPECAGGSDGISSKTAAKGSISVFFSSDEWLTITQSLRFWLYCKYVRVINYGQKYNRILLESDREKKGRRCVGHRTNIDEVRKVSSGDGRLSENPSPAMMTTNSSTPYKTVLPDPPPAPYQDCTSCRIIGSGALGATGVYALMSSRASAPGSPFGKRIVGGLGVGE